VGGRRKQSTDERNNAAGKRAIQVHNAKVHGKDADTGEDILKRETSNVKRETVTLKKNKKKKTNNKKSINNKRKK
jgi:hypothetical protein